MIADLDAVAEFRDTELFLVELVHDHAVFLFHVHQVALNNVPGFAQATAGVEADNLDVLDTAVGLFPVGEILNVLFSLVHAGGRQHLVVFAFGEHAAGIKVADAAKNDPEVRVGMVDVVGSGGGEAEEQTKLNNDQDQCEDDTGEGNRKTDAVVKEVAASEKSHGQSSWRCTGGIRNGAEKSNVNS